MSSIEDQRINRFRGLACSNLRSEHVTPFKSLRRAPRARAERRPRARLHHADQGRAPPAQNASVVCLLDHTVARARALELIDPDARDDKTLLVAADATGMESRHTSTYFGRRSGQKMRRFPKFWAAVHAASHVCLALACGAGPGPDDPRFAPLARATRGAGWTSSRP